jgi:uncharacterized protein (TIGR00730 family)
MSFRRLCVYCGSSNHVEASYLEAAYTLGRLLAEDGIGVVCGGGSVGLMGRLADGALEASGEVVGVIPKKLLDLELGHKGLTELRVVEGMHPRKALMAELSDGFIALPGGYGTLEELFEVVTWGQLHYHQKPVGVLNINGYFDLLLGFIDKMCTERFIRPIHRDMLQASGDPRRLLEAMRVYRYPQLEEWIDDP